MQHIKDMSNYRIEQAEQCLKSAKMLIDAEDYKGAANRSYYAIFHAMRSSLLFKTLILVSTRRSSATSARNISSRTFSVSNYPIS